MSQPVPTQRPLPTDRQLRQTLLDQGLRTIVTVPCSITASWHAWADEASHQGRLELLSSSHEGNLIGLAAGSWFGTGRPALVQLHYERLDRRLQPGALIQPWWRHHGDQHRRACRQAGHDAPLPTTLQPRPTMTASPWPEGAPQLHPHEATARLEPVDCSQLSAAMLGTLERIPGDGLKGAGFPRNVLGELLYSPELLAPFLEWWVSAKSAMALTEREQELVILRMGCLYASDYVWKHHVPVGREFGISDDELAAIRSGSFAGFVERERALLELSEEMVNRRTVSAAAWAQYGQLLPARDLVDLIALISQYVLFALTNNVLQVPLEPALAGDPGLAD